jgi:hypothetical protein
MTLRLVLTYHWFDEMAAGRKNVEYRAMTPHWRKRIWAKRHQLTSAIYSRAYTATTLRREIYFIDIGPCPYPGWPGKYYRIHHVE